MAEPTKIRTFPVQLVEVKEGILLVRGATEVNIQGPGAAEAIKAILLACSGRGATAEELLGLFPAPQREAAEGLIEHLLERRILVGEGPLEPVTDRAETPLDIFYWDFGLAAEGATQRLNEQRLVLVGINHLSRRVAEALRLSGLTGFQVVDYELLRNQAFFDAEGTLEKWPSELPSPIPEKDWFETADPELLGGIIGCSDFGGETILRDWNDYCVRNELLFLPVVLSHNIGSIGPLVIPGETACFECLRARENSQLDDPDLQRAAEYQAVGGQAVKGFHPLMASAVADMAVMELVKFLTFVMPWRIGELIEVNLLAPDLVARKVLKVPRCPVCSPLSKRSAHSPLKRAFEPDNYQDYVAE